MSNEELLEKVRELAAQKEKSAVCPHCGHCKECGRGATPVYPIPWWQQTTPNPYPYTIWYSASGTGHGNTAGVFRVAGDMTATFIGNANATPTAQ